MKVWYTLAEACEYMGLKERKIRNLTKEGRLRYTKPDKKFMFHKNWIDAYLLDMGTRLTPTQKKELADLS